jgi:hypothetical protein
LCRARRRRRRSSRERNERQDTGEERSKPQGQRTVTDSGLSKRAPICCGRWCRTSPRR